MPAMVGYLNHWATAAPSETRRTVIRSLFGKDRKLQNGVILQQGNDRPFSAKRVIERIEELGFEALEPPPYITDLAPSDFRSFGSLKEALKGRKFTTDEEVVYVIKN
ncbi:hypothetical protein TNCV_304041 [Trichonephila clavipes]|nr:hypothetical protein TNCV_304041 [Trichonephila clavipes]